MSIDETLAVMKAGSDETVNEWEKTRLSCYYTVVSQHGSKDFPTPQSLFPLPWDKTVKKEIQKPLSREELDKLHKYYLLKYGTKQRNKRRGKDNR